MVFPLIAAALIGGGAALISGAMGANAAEKAAKAQTDSANNSLALQERIYEENKAASAPWLDAGKKALAQYQGELGLSTTGADGQPFESQYTSTPGYEFRVAEGEKGIVNNLAALGMKNSGAALKAVERFRQDYATQDYGNYMTRLGNLATGGQQQAAADSAMGQQHAQSAGNTMQQAGAARASGYVGAANSWSNALSNMSNMAGNLLGKYDQNWQHVGSTGNAFGGLY